MISGQALNEYAKTIENMNYHYNYCLQIELNCSHLNSSDSTNNNQTAPESL